MSSVLIPRSRSTAYSSSPKSSPTGPTTRTSVKKLAASEKWTAEPPSMRSRSPNGVLTESNAMEPTTTRLMGGAAYLARQDARDTDRRMGRARGHAAGVHAGARAWRGRGADRGLARGRELRRHPPAREQLHRALGAAARAGRRGGGDGARRGARRPAGRGDDRHGRLRAIRDRARGHDLPAP